MLRIYERWQLLHAAYSNAQMRLDAYGAMRLFQNITGEHSIDLGVDNDSMLCKSNAFWVVTKMKMRFVQTPRMFEQAWLRTWPLAARHGVCERCYTLETPEGGALCARSEWALLDAGTHKLRRPESTCYPVDFDFCTERVLEEPFQRLRPDFTGLQPCMYRRILPTDIDMSRHTNNTQYARFVLDCFPVAFFDEHELAELEIHFLKESREGEELAVYKEQTSSGVYLLAGVNGAGQRVFAACMKVRRADWMQREDIAAD